MNSQRKESRNKLVAFTPVYDLLHKTLLGYVGDLTLQGVMVIGEKPIEVNKHFTLGIEFSDNSLEAPTVRIVIPARVAWCRQDANSQVNIGFESIDVSPDNIKKIEAILARYQFRPVSDS
jgi:hypothetical protein